MDDMTLFLFHVKSKYRRKCSLTYTFSVIFLLFVTLLRTVYCIDCVKTPCDHGSCVNQTCVCDPGWQGDLCESCGGRFRLNSSEAGVITDGAGNYSIDTKCAWVIDTGLNNVTLRFRLDAFATECGWDHLYVYDGDSIYSTLVAAFSGLLVQQDSSGDSSGDGSIRVPEVTTHSGKAYLYFYSDVAYTMPGFSITYR
ncbi:PREDICTED: attractin-like protein 1 [Priapulus caudatus]|uniref:Attractin-like protein 1 n=1 Tax=Priapulus caudatus TaxID=37621 RepID=A0ABM1E7M4_PRICU|nr:PREDICTED: attractin-like protein 1 [Priapulus caudatus]